MIECYRYTEMVQVQVEVGVKTRSVIIATVSHGHMMRLYQGTG